MVFYLFQKTQQHLNARIRNCPEIFKCNVFENKAIAIKINVYEINNNLRTNLFFTA